MKKKKYLPLYEQWIKDGRMSYVVSFENYIMDERLVSGLCDLFDNAYFRPIYPEFQLMKPVDEDIRQLREENKDEHCWGSDSPSHQFYIFTPLRQNIVLFMAAMNGEL